MNTESQAVRATTRDRNGRQLVVRRLGRGDLRALQGFNRSLSHATQSIFYPHRYSSGVIARYIQRSLSGQDLAYLVWAGKKVVAYCFLWELTDPVPHLGIGIVDAWQNQGLGKYLMRILIADARKHGARGIALTTTQENERAFHVYRRSGFRYTGDIENIAGGGVVWKERAMFLPLRRGAKPSRRPFRPPV